MFCTIHTEGKCTPCETDYCLYGGTCIVNDTDCSKTCSCPSYTTGQKCEYTSIVNTNNTNASTNVPYTTTTSLSLGYSTKPSTVTTLRPLTERTCMFGMLTCMQGYCQNGYKCVCDNYWSGPKCNDLICPSVCNDMCEVKDGNVVCTNSINTTSITSNIQPTPLPLEQSNDIAFSETTTLRDINNRQCFPGFVCSHGYCDVNVQNNLIACKCDKNWKGGLCDILDCPLECLNNCYIENSTVKCFDQSPVSSISVPPLTSFTIDHTTKASTSTTIRDQTCIPGFVCKHGYCKRFTTYFQCECDPNWTGPFCDKLNCPNCISGCILTDNSIQCVSPSSTTTKNISQLITTTIDPTTTLIPNNFTYPAGHVCSANYTKTPGFCFIPCQYGQCKIFPNGSFKCACDPGATGDMCEKRCCKLCSNDGLCKKDENGTEYCNCQYDYAGEFCQTKIVPKEKETWYWWVVGVCLGLIVLLILLLVVLPYWMWRNRVILIMKIVHYFQRYEDNDDREWDAFISYKCDDKDESFVLRQLYSKLEVEMGFRLCLHFRDFIPGDTIANNIIRAVQGSRRTILLLTPRYVKSEFTKFEYQMAQTEMLKRRHRIIPLVLEDISPCRSELDPNLEQIINSVTYLEWPVDEDSTQIQKFWKKLVLSMPKKKDVEERRKAMSSSGSTSYSLTSQFSEIPLVGLSDNSSSNGVSIMSSDSNSNSYLPSDSIKNSEIILKIPNDSYDVKENGNKPSNLDHNINTYLDLIDHESFNCSHT